MREAINIFIESIFNALLIGGGLVAVVSLISNVLFVGLDCTSRKQEE